VAGDIFDRSAPDPESEHIVYRALLELAATAPVICVAGNHDHPGRLEAVAPLLQLGRVTVAPTLARPEEGGVISLEQMPAKIALLPFLSQRKIVSADDLMSLDPDVHRGMYAQRVRMVVDRLCEGMTAETVNLVIGHAMVAGAVQGGGEREVHLFGYEVPAASFPGHLSYVALGHLHRLQKIPAACPMWYSGSPLQLDFGEVSDQKGVLVAEMAPGLPAIVKEHHLQNGRRLVRLIGSFEQVREEAGKTGDAFLRIELDEPPRPGLADEVRALFPEAIDVRLVESRRPVASPRQSRLDRSSVELFAEYLEQKGGTDRELLDLFDELLAEAHEA
jgi:DNA repair protein SbcD/Mre11